MNSCFFLPALWLNTLLTRARSGGAGLSAAAMAAMTSGPALVGQAGGGAVGGDGGAHGRPRDPAIGGAQQAAGRARPAAGCNRRGRILVKMKSF